MSQQWVGWGDSTVGEAARFAPRATHTNEQE
eukprot:CAMPEP_0174363080 /NCGR_PEP_ID=MMETSP0811_2-20130205/67240_1 /TAXON_ID=73025 ORGANISM="Eutreptiella gymnastica-like, Strain CCMP1594" /NCGR_SAMPLE_ID=MMETSP0811_2 /ASSEMBLY_ACC=CAM_ASM_000667 /LENGTH=30 /DNA_ID= /DNA_START= /DNA_END= /DNA_ORIENTATION=